MFAVQEGFVETVDSLIAAGANVNARDNRRRTVLMQAARCSQSVITARLLAAGANPRATAFCDQVITAAIVAATVGADDVIRLLAEAGADLNFLDDKDGYSALMMAAYSGHAETVRLLLSLGADVTDYTEYSDTALTMARRGGYPEIIEILQAADPDAADTTPIIRPQFPWDRPLL